MWEEYQDCDMQRKYMRQFYYHYEVFGDGAGNN